MVVALALGVTLTAGTLRTASASAPPAGSPITLGFPRLAIWWPDNEGQPAAERARFDYIELMTNQADHIPELRAANPNIILLASSNARELNFDAEMRQASAQWLLTQQGSTLTGAVDAGTGTFPVADTSRFRTGDYVVVQEEIAKVTGIGSGVIYVQRGAGKAAAAHPSGIRIAAALSAWPGALEYDLTANCPRVDVGNGPETWAEWNARRGANAVKSAAWDGLLVDCYDGPLDWMVSQGLARSIDYYRNNTVPTDGYAAFKNAWRAGMVDYGNKLRAAAGANTLITVNSGVSNYTFNGGTIETFPRMDNSLETWNWLGVSDHTDGTASYLQWTKQGAKPNLSTVLTYQYDGAPPSGWQTNFVPNYQKMRFGLTTALLGDGFFAYEISTYGQASLKLMWFDEYDNAGQGKGYLGQPTGAAYQAMSNVWRRDFQNGISLVNPTAGPVTVQLGGTFRKIKGTQAPSVNDGSLVTQVTIPSHDGIVLLRTTTTPPPVVTPPPAPVDTTAPTSRLVDTNGNVAQRWYTTPDLTLNLTATDTGSGVQSITLDRAHGIETVQSPFQFTIHADSNREITYYATDKAGNVEAKRSQWIGLDQTPPTVTSNAAGPYTGSASIALSASDVMSGVARIAYRVDGAASETIGSVVNLGPGTHTVAFRAQDVAGNWSAVSSVGVSVSAAPGAPTGLAAMPAAGPAIALTWTDTSSDEGGFVIERAQNGTASFTQIAQVGANTTSYTDSSVDWASTWYYRVRSFNSSGSSAWAGPVSVKVDGTAPVSTALVNGVAPKAGWYNVPASLSLSAADSQSGSSGSFFDAGAGTQVYSAPVVMPEGSSRVTYWSIDKAGNTEAARTVDLKVDTTAPTVVSDASSAAYAGKAVIVLTGTDAGSGVARYEYSIDGGTAVSGQTITLAPAATTTYQLRFRTQDVAGNWSAWSTQSVTVSVAATSHHVPLHRFYNWKTATYLYTTNDAEVAALTSGSNAGTYRHDGISFHVADVPGSSDVPVYRFREVKKGVSTYLYTASEAEKNALLASANTSAWGFRYDGVAFYAGSSSAAGQPVHRFYIPRKSAYFYTTNEAEKNAALADRGYRYEGIAFYGFTQ